MKVNDIIFDILFHLDRGGGLEKTTPSLNRGGLWIFPGGNFLKNNP